jgi:hypothetical protein
VIGLDEPVAVKPPGLEVTVYELIGSLEKLGAVKDTLAVVDVGDVALTLVGTPGAPLVEPEDEVKIGMGVFYLKT